MLNIEDMTIVVEAMYRDELRLISQSITENKSTLTKLELQKSFLLKHKSKSLFKKIKMFFTRQDNYNELAINQLMKNLDLKIATCKGDLEKLYRQSNEIYNIYSYIIEQIQTNDLLYMKNLILMRGIKISNKQLIDD
jgi:hypothetical protein